MQHKVTKRCLRATHGNPLATPVPQRPTHSAAESTAETLSWQNATATILAVQLFLMIPKFL